MGATMLFDDPWFDDQMPVPPMDTARPVSLRGGGTSAGLLALYFGNDLTAGLFQNAAGQIAIAAGGVRNVSFGANFSNWGQGSSDYLLAINTQAGASRQIQIQTAGVARWNWFGNNTAEGGSNAGTDLQLARYDDAGSFLGYSWFINRATGAMSFDPSLSFGVAGQVLISRGSAAPPAWGNYGVMPSPAFMEDIDPLGLSSEVIEGGRASSSNDTVTRVSFGKVVAAANNQCLA